jgi:hypothetical protein
MEAGYPCCFLDFPRPLTDTICGERAPPDGRCGHCTLRRFDAQPVCDGPVDSLVLAHLVPFGARTPPRAVGGARNGIRSPSAVRLATPGERCAVRSRPFAGRIRCTRIFAPRAAGLRQRRAFAAQSAVPTHSSRPACIRRRTQGRGRAAGRTVDRTPRCEPASPRPARGAAGSSAPAVVDNGRWSITMTRSGRVYRRRGCVCVHASPG